VLGAIVDADLSNEAFPFLTAREVEVAWAKAWALRASFTGELGWELYVPTEFAAGVYDAIVSAGAHEGIRHAGAFAFDALRLERGFRSWGHDIGSLDDPFIAGLGFTVKLGKDADFVGKARLAARLAEPHDRRLVSVKLDEPERTLWHGESVLRDDERVGHVTSGAYGFTVGGGIGLAWVHGPDGVRPFYDPSGARARI
jgi:4-methylaminobutanoate oxidase (formaldehyde-forming)